MLYPSNIDLHMHTTVSDGTDTPAELLSRVRASGMKVFAVTDHDSFKACDTIRNHLGKDDPDFITGVEFSCRDEDGKYHILGYGFDVDADAIRQVVELGHSYRVKKLRARLSFLDTAFGFRFREEDTQTLFAMDNPGKPHIANLMVKYGFAETKEKAIKNYINQMRFRSEYVRPEEAIEGILGSGGIPVLAHPAYGSGDDIILGTDMEKRLYRLEEFGLKGVEAFYSGFSGKIREEMLELADRYGLYVTAGSDYHGANKLVSIGDTGLGEVDEWPEGLKRFLDAVTAR